MASVVLAASCGSGGTAARNLVRTAGDDSLRAGSTYGDDLTRQLPRSFAVRVQLRDRITDLSEDPQVQDALFGMSWNASCSIVAGYLADDVPSVAEFLTGIAADFGISFLDDGAQVVAEIVIEAVDEEPYDQVEAQCQSVGDSL